MKLLEGEEAKKADLEIVECDCGYHMGIDASFLDQVGDFEALCPACGRTIKTADFSTEAPEDEEFMGLDVQLSHGTKDAFPMVLRIGPDKLESPWLCTMYLSCSCGVKPEEVIAALRCLPWREAKAPVTPERPVFHDPSPEARGFVTKPADRIGEQHGRDPNAK